MSIAEETQAELLDAIACGEIPLGWHMMHSTWHHLMLELLDDHKWSPYLRADRPYMDLPVLIITGAQKEWTLHTAARHWSDGDEI